jgi:hypothetical protein
MMAVMPPASHRRAPHDNRRRRVEQPLSERRRSSPGRYEPVDPCGMDISGVNSAMSGLAAAQAMFGTTAQAAAGVSTPDPGDSNGSTAEALQVAVLQKSLEMERSTVNILA